MKKDVKKAMPLYLVTDRRWLKEPLIQTVEKAIQGGVTCVQLREKHLDQKYFVESARQLLSLCHQHHIPLIINDDVDVMITVQADGVHVGQNDMDAKKVREMIGPDKILGVSVRTVEQALKAQQDGADYLGVGSIFVTHTKDDAKKVEIQTLKDICQAVDIPVIAIGGIGQNNLLQLKGTGIDGVAVVSAIMAQDDVFKAAQNLKGKVKEDIL
ncbi:thiamine phosphate synthase [Clostridium sp. C1]|uniref:thiamine phosphate synthase n=1 Tax=Clostridium sp. C1 TaxID=1155388 RepID=UPI001BA6BD29|nr:thiamine phosphate synthase [Clostridium sp. C1]QUN12365.1 thiamine phosphate synthase [Clostridium sp. C1]